jgi:hypothetical protein
VSAENRGWGQGWPNCQSANIVKVTCGGNGLKLPVRSAIAPLVPPLVLDLETARARPFRPDWSWGYSCRAIAGTTTPSNHSWGLAIDLDAPENPQLTKTKHGASHTLRKTFPGGQVLRSTMPDDVLAIARKHGFEWGGLFAKPDPMHFEFLGTPEDAANRAQNPGSMPMPLRGPSPSPTPAGGLTRTYTVKAGDTLSQIGQRLGVKWRKLAADNNVPPPTFIIHPGQVLWF